MYFDVLSKSFIYPSEMPILMGWNDFYLVKR